MKPAPLPPRPLRPTEIAIQLAIAAELKRQRLAAPEVAEVQL